MSRIDAGKRDGRDQESEEEQEEEEEDCHGDSYLVAFGLFRLHARVVGQRPLGYLLGSRGRPLWILLQALLKRAGAFQGEASWGPSWRLWGPLCGARWRSRGSPWALLGACSAVLGPTGVILGAIWGSFSAILDALRVDTASMLNMCAYPRDWGDVCLAGPSWSSFGCIRGTGTAYPNAGCPCSANGKYNIRKHILLHVPL